MLNGNENDPVNDPVKGEETLEKNLHSIYNIIKGSPSATYSDIANQLNKSIATVKRNLQKLKEFGIIKREGSDKTGRWIILK
ncbi:winged helix-turn-helix domain-containing protein [Muribaculum sp.]|uniref:winged helix-turn-helix domain-containing protein n=1 Tax=Muribaculum sp. TaxID=1918611 RepID=UPI0025877D42|nr:winged helix-turn-helix domain-containing protein [Muribaculum sp.]MCX4278818.1 winged helix-turn-helix domain-containing protein [Muribaculum sp.]